MGWGLGENKRRGPFKSVVKDSSFIHIYNIGVFGFLRFDYFEKGLIQVAVGIGPGRGGERRRRRKKKKQEPGIPARWTILATPQARHRRFKVSFFLTRHFLNPPRPKIKIRIFVTYQIIWPARLSELFRDSSSSSLIFGSSYFRRVRKCLDM